MNIQHLQNLPSSIDKLLAQRLLYRRAKSWRFTGLALVAAVVGLVFASLSVDAPTFTSFVSLAVAVTWFIDQVVIADRIASLKDEAARIQEDFDCTVLDIPWPDHRAVHRPLDDRVRLLAQDARRVPRLAQDIHDWYTPNAIPDDQILARLHCQRMNVLWDHDLRKAWNTAITTVSATIVITLIVVAAALGTTLLKALVAAAMSLRIVAWIVVEIRAQKAAIQVSASLHQFLSDTLVERSLHDVRLAQDMVFEHRRSSPTVPDWFYRVRRSLQHRQHSAQP